MNWIYKGKEVIELPKSWEEFYGFIYLITYKDGTKYIGQKKLLSKRKKKLSKLAIKKRGNTKGLKYNLSARKNKSTGRKDRVFYEMIIKESDWKTYLGSNKNIRQDKKKELVLKKEILHLCKTKKLCGYMELKEMFARDVLESDEYHNANIAGKYFKNMFE